MKLWIIIASLLFGYQSAWACNDNDALYKGCSSQLLQIRLLRANAARDGKLMVLTFGADWDQESRVVHNVISHVKPYVADGIAFANVGIYMPGSMQASPSGQEIRAEFLARNSLSTDQVKLGMPMIMVIRPSDSKVVLIKSTALKNGRRFSARKALGALNRAVYKLENQ